MKVEPGMSPNITHESGGTKLPGNKSLSQEDFLKVFLTQMTTQDPMKPFSSGDMLQQMSQMTALTASQGLEKSINMMNANLGNSQVLTATQLIGKQVVMASGVTPLANDGLNGSVVLPQDATAVTVEIRDKSDNLVKSVNLPRSSSGVVDFHWDGLDSEGKPMNPDYYKISAKATINNAVTDVPTAGYFKVNSVTMDRQNSSVMLNLEGMGGIKMNEIIKILS